MKLTVDGNNFEVSVCGAPKAPGVYLVIVANPRNKTYKVMYVGSSTNIHGRVSNLAHPYRKLFSKYVNLWVATASCITTDYKSLEIKAIQFFKPSLNIQHNGK